MPELVPSADLSLSRDKPPAVPCLFTGLSELLVLWALTSRRTPASSVGTKNMDACCLHTPARLCAAWPKGKT